jgi:predicted ATP-grasp superfamily ATP-dependent carboligase
MRWRSISATPIARRSTLSADRAPILIAALSGRALAEAAHRAGERVIVLDAFADDDTQRFAGRTLVLPRTELGFDAAALLGAVLALAPGVRGVVYGAGFEHDPPLLARLGAMLPLLGNSPATVALVKHPLRLAALLAELALPHPETTLVSPPIRAGAWLKKRIGGAGGGHVAAATARDAAPGVYFQRRVAGAPLSALFVANGKSARILGFSEQWVAAAADAPFRYGGCAGPVTPPAALATSIADACDRIARAAGLVGLNSIDLLVDGGACHIIEINPRPGASLDVFDGAGGRSLWPLHLAGVAGRLPARRSLADGTSRAAAIVYADRALAVPRAMAWPRWSADRGGPGSRVAAGEPLCTVRAAAKDAAAARRLAERRAGEILLRVAAAGSAPARGR